MYQIITDRSGVPPPPLRTNECVEKCREMYPLLRAIHSRIYMYTYTVKQWQVDDREFGIKKRKIYEPGKSVR